MAAYTLLTLAAGLALYGLQRRRRSHDRLAATHAAERAASEAPFRSLTRLSSDRYWEQDASLRFVRIAGDADHPVHRSMEGYVGPTRWGAPALNLGDADWACQPLNNALAALQGAGVAQVGEAVSLKGQAQAAIPTLTEQAALAKSGTDGEWASF